MRKATKYISKSALTHNLQTLSKRAKYSKIIAVVKANAYGCEAALIYDALQNADVLAVACIEEALDLRDAGCQKPIILLEGVFEADELVIADQNFFECVIATSEQLEWLVKYVAKSNFKRIWLKIDTGMGRLGFNIRHAKIAMNQLLRHYHQKNIVLMTHFSDADSDSIGITRKQITQFDEFAKYYPECEQSVSNSASTLVCSEAHRDYVRLGIALYGVSPFANSVGSDYGLKPVMSLTTRVFSIKSFPKGSPIGYGQTYRMKEDGLIAVCAIGYADGYLRFIPNGTTIMIAGREYSIAGQISMDMITVLVDEKVRVGDDVTCWGNTLCVETVSRYAQTIPYQLLTTITKRVKVVVE